MRKAIILLLVASMLSLASCGNKSVETTTGADGSSNAQTSSVVSADVSSVVLEDISSELVSSDDSVSSVASENTKSTKTKATKTKNTSSEKNKFSSKAEQIKAVFLTLSPSYEVEPVKSQIKNDPSIVETEKNYEDHFGEVKSTAEMPKKELSIHKKNVRYYMNSVSYGHIKNWEKEHNLSLSLFAYFGKVDGYNLFYANLNTGSIAMPGGFNRLGGYQFLTLPDFVRNHGPYDKYGNANVSPKKFITYSGIILEKDGNYSTLEDLYIDNVITAETVGKVYNVLPKCLQMGKFENYKDAYNLGAGKLHKNSTAFIYTEKKDGYKADFISYYDKDGKFHVVYADD